MGSSSQPCTRMKWLLLAAVVAGALVASDARSEDDARIVAAYSTRTVVTLTTLTSTVPLTCAVYFGAAVCQKPRFRRFSNIDEDLMAGDDLNPLLEGTLDMKPDALDDMEEARAKREAVEAGRDPRIALTVWSTTSSTYTLSYYCTAVGASMPPAC